MLLLLLDNKQQQCFLEITLLFLKICIHKTLTMLPVDNIVTYNLVFIILYVNNHSFI